MITLAVTAYRESQREGGKWIRRCVSAAAQHPFIGEILVYDDGSDDFGLLKGYLAGTPKLRLLHGAENIGVFGAKYTSVANASYNWVQLCDSDNFMGPGYFDSLASHPEWPDDTWLCPSFARPNFDYRHLAGIWTMPRIPRLSRQKLFLCCVNTGNQCVPRDRFLNLFAPYMRGGRIDKTQPAYFARHNQNDDLQWRLIYDAADSFFFNKMWLLEGGRLHIHPSLHYDHHWTLGKSSSWVRAPALKDALSVIYCHELRQAASDRWVDYEFIDRTEGHPTLYTLSASGKEIRIDGDTLEEL